MTRDKDDAGSAESWTVPEGGGRLPSAATAPSFSTGDVVGQRYELRRVLGRGGMGVVFEAYDRVLDQAIALKIVRAEYAGDRAWAERLAREVKLARQINHQNVCRVYDIGVADRHPFLTMELATRGTLRDEIASGEYAARPLDDRLADVRAVAAGLAAIHAAGIIHRDVSPQNVLRLSDGSLVLSDFGLATDRFDGTSSIQGGTLAYMAPEVVRGARASIASDIWSLAVLIHEVVFGARPRWAPNGKDLLPADLGRSPLPPEKVVFQVCRTCLAETPSTRPGRTADVAQWLSQGMPIWGRRLRRAVGAAAAIGFVVVAGVFAIAHARRRSEAGDQASAAQPPILTPTGVAEDWTAIARILTSVPGKITCMTLLPDRRTLRFVWGTERKAEDVDIQTGATVQSPLVPASYAEGCPRLTIRGDKILFPGHDADDHPVAFVSSHPNGSDARAVIQIAEPSMDSDPAWFPDGDSFLYPIDVKHAAVYSMSSRTTTVVPVDTLGAVAVNYVVAGDAILVAVAESNIVTSLRRFWYPHMRQDLYVRIQGFVLDATSAHDDRRYYLSLWQDGRRRTVATVDASAGSIEAVGYLPDQRIRFPISTPLGLAFVGATVRPVLVVSSRAGQIRQIELDPTILTASACGDGFIAMRAAGPGVETDFLDSGGRVVRPLGAGNNAGWPACSRDGQQVFYATIGASPEIRRCISGSCTPVYHGRVNGFELSPDGARIVTVAVGDDGFTVKWLSADGQGGEHDVTRTAVACPPEWSSNDTFWVSTRRGRRTEWREFDVLSSTWTGRQVPGKWDCTDGEEDPASPAAKEVRLIHKRTSEIRLIPAAHLAGR